KIVRLLEVRHNNTGKYRAEEGFKQLDTINDVLNKLTLIIGAIAGISLIVGGIGVMNIMLVSVTERTREIGIRKAIGATMADIRIQFLTESLILCLVGGIIGMSLGVVVGNIVGKFLNIKAAISVQVILIAFLFSSAVGIFFGLYPANKAARLDPIEALRYE
ncbi:MAG TPA: macrolide ABC transporter permease, partial [Clostridiaceae bacterium]|nr:macrolide ABC transporter permease [Clostridiaceae bacterium]